MADNSSLFADCQDLLIVTEPSGVITSPNWPHKYKDNMNCTTRIQPGYSGKLIIVIDSIDIEAMTAGDVYECWYDKLQVLLCQNKT